MLDGRLIAHMDATNSVFAPSGTERIRLRSIGSLRELRNSAPARTQLRTLGGHLSSICCQRSSFAAKRQPGLGSVLTDMPVDTAIHNGATSSNGTSTSSVNCPAGFFGDVAYAGSHGVHLEQYSTKRRPASLIPSGLRALRSQCSQSCAYANGMAGTNPNPSLIPTRPYGCSVVSWNARTPQYNGLSLGGYGCCSSTYNSLQATVTRRFQGGGTLLVAYTNSKLMSNTDTLTSWLEGATGGVGAVQDWNNLKGERSLSSQDVSQRLVISYVLDLPFGHGKAFANSLQRNSPTAWFPAGASTVSPPSNAASR
jgi:hypothetical protein